jgi:hypothetical protein
MSGNRRPTDFLVSRMNGQSGAVDGGITPIAYASAIDMEIVRIIGLISLGSAVRLLCVEKAPSSTRLCHRRKERLRPLGQAANGAGARNPADLLAQV